MFMSNKDLPAYGKAFAWVLVLLFGSVSVFVLSKAIQVFASIQW